MSAYYTLSCACYGIATDTLEAYRRIAGVPLKFDGSGCLKSKNLSFRIGIGGWKAV